MGSRKTRLIVRNDAEISAKVRTSELWRGEYVSYLLDEFALFPKPEDFDDKRGGNSTHYTK